MRRFRALIEERANKNREMTIVFSYVKQHAASAFMQINSKRIAKENGSFINVLGKRWTQEINGVGVAVGTKWKCPCGYAVAKLLVHKSTAVNCLNKLQVRGMPKLPNVWMSELNAFELRNWKFESPNWMFRFNSAWSLNFGQDGYP